MFEDFWSVSYAVDYYFRINDVCKIINDIANERIMFCLIYSKMCTFSEEHFTTNPIFVLLEQRPLISIDRVFLYIFFSEAIIAILLHKYTM